jgi:hypothetical protein
MDKKKYAEYDRSKFTLDQFIPYQIKIAGRLGENWSGWLDQMDIQIEIDSSGLATTILTGFIDQAALIGLLRQLYSLGYPLISVNCIQMVTTQP